MVGHLVLSPARRPRVALEVERVGGLRLLRAAVAAPEGIGEKRQRRRIGRAARLLAEERVRRVLTGPGFCGWDLLREWGLIPVSPEPLVQSMAAPLVLAALERRGILPERARVALAAPRANRAVYQTAMALCPRVRQLLVAAPDGGEALADLLREEFGMPRLEGEEGRGADLTVRLGNVPCSGSGVRLDLFGPRPGLLGLELDAEGLPPFEGEKLPFLTLLWEEGRIPPGNIRVI